LRIPDRIGFGKKKSLAKKFLAISFRSNFQKFFQKKKVFPRHFPDVKDEQLFVKKRKQQIALSSTLTNPLI